MNQISRSTERFSLYDELHVSYEGFSGRVPVRVPDLSTQGMFINTGSWLPIGAVLSVSFLLPKTRVRINARAEVRYCVPSQGVGIEFINLDEQHRSAIETELVARLCPFDHCKQQEGNRLVLPNPRPEEKSVAAQAPDGVSTSE